MIDINTFWRTCRQSIPTEYRSPNFTIEYPKLFPLFRQLPSVLTIATKQYLINISPFGKWQVDKDEFLLINRTELFNHFSPFPNLDEMINCILFHYNRGTAILPKLIKEGLTKRNLEVLQVNLNLLLTDSKKATFDEIFKKQEDLTEKLVFRLLLEEL